MNDPSGAVPPQPPPPPPTATVRARSRRRRISLVWIIPLVTLLIGGYLAWDSLSQRGPSIQITFQTAEGLQAGQSQVKHKDVSMGTVEAVRLAPDLQHVIVRVRMNSEATPLLTDRAQFWVVKPRFFAGSVSGLDTLLSGSYIELLPSSAGGTPERKFTGLEEPPVLTSDVPGHTFLLHAGRIGSISLGSPIFFRDFQVGQVLGWDLGDMADSVTIHAFVRAPFDKYVHDGSRFWNASGVTLKLGGGNGIELQLESIKALLLGGVAFDTPPAARNTAATAENHVFRLYPTRNAADAASYTRQLPLVTYFNTSASGLAEGADVVFHGLKIGTVTAVNLQYDPTNDAVLLPVHYEIEPQRISGMRMAPQEDIASEVAKLVGRGLRVSLETSNFLTGQKQVAVNFYPDAPAASIGREGDVFVIPPAPGGGSNDILAAAGALMSKLDAIPFTQIGDNLNSTLAGASALTNGPELKQAVAELRTTLATAQDTLQKVDRGVQPAMAKLPEIAAGLQETVTRANRLLGSVDAGYGANSDFRRSLDRLMATLADTARSVRSLSDLLTRHPEALIRGRTDQGTE